MPRPGVRMFACQLRTRAVRTTGMVAASYKLRHAHMLLQTCFCIDACGQLRVQQHTTAAAICIDTLWSDNCTWVQLPDSSCSQTAALLCRTMPCHRPHAAAGHEADGFLTLARTTRM
jgi:hypothetical protein